MECPPHDHNQRRKKAQCNAEENHIKTPVLFTCGCFLHILCQYVLQVYFIEITIKTGYLTNNSNQIWIIFS